ncbi:cysteine desulfurase [Thermococcus thioreducens]|uniref:cysteine desulfurase n=1 Tax=Thermococcus thioreducens TaxID=277988 RepID=A0A0Q2MSW2_9EURY|nr:cysteine desulfurase [Thermococcus thioreducens]ASJ11943.1 cysteine desulfurase [Thermococcus thioreducens]KQH82831.1 cysteine desulfurase [Thermococcus thioreducens]SEW11199.1 cysteine desulfurase / selenocysteine lyase [Thermococcus thioreducens]
MRIPEDVRKDIPLTSEVIYFDNTATSLTPRPVIEAMDEYYLRYRANVHRGIHRLSQMATHKYEESRKVVADFLNAKFEEIVFTKNTSESLNLVALGLEHIFKPGDRIVTTPYEHHSDLLPWQRLAKKLGLKLEFIEGDDEGNLDLSDAERKIKGAKLVAVQHVSNALGVIHEVEELGKMAKEAGAIFVVDAAQSTGHMEVDVRKMNADFLGLSGHKGPMGPTGIGVLYINEEFFDTFEPPLIGGGTIEDVDLCCYKLTEPPERFEAGTPNIGGAIGLAAGIRYIEKIGIDKIERQEHKLVKRITEGLDELEVPWYGPRNLKKHAGVVSFNVPGLHPHDVAAVLDNHNIMVRSGHHCALPVMKRLGINGTVRASFHVYNSLEEVETFLGVMEELVRSLR